MGDSLEVHHGGLTQAQEALDGQSDEAQVVLDYVRSACADNGAFGRGFLALFQGTYGDAFAAQNADRRTGRAAAASNRVHILPDQRPELTLPPGFQRRTDLVHREHMAGCVAQQFGGERA